jgi:azobenzene reductase
MKVAVLLGSVRKGRQSHKVAYYLERLLNESGIETDLIDLSESPLPLLEQKDGNSPEVQKQITLIGSRLRTADTLIFVTPEYHGSFSGVLKNTLDYFWSEFSKKPIGVVTVSAGKFGGINASTQLQNVILSLGAFPLPVKLLVPEVQDAFDQSYNPTQESIKRNARKFLTELLWLAEAITAKRRIELSVATEN